MAAALVSLKPVQELVQIGVPEQYIQHDANGQLADADLPLMDSPILDFSLLSSQKDELQNLRFALSTWGCTQVVNHGISSSYLDQVREMSKEFFKLPIEEKEKYSDNGGLEGYGNTNAFQTDSFNWNDKLLLAVNPLDKRQLQFWPQNPHTFRKTLEEYSNKVKIIVETLLKSMARSLKLEENKFLELWNGEEDIIHARFNFYPRCPTSNLVVGLKPHGDGTAITILLQDKEVEALRVLKDGEWFRVPTIPDALVILVGDQMEITSNGIFKSPTHKVIVNPEHDRISLAMLTIPDPEKEIGPVHELITKERPQMYKRLKDYGKIYRQDIPTGKRPIDTVKIN